MRAWLDLSPVADMPLAFLVERIGAACLVDQRRIELQCDLPCKPFRLRSRCAAGATQIGTRAKRDWEQGETSLDSPPILLFAALTSASPLANQVDLTLTESAKIWLI